MCCRRQTLLGLLLGAVLCLAVAPGIAGAAQLGAGGSVTIPQGERIDDDLYVTGGTVTVDGEVRRDLFVGAGTVVLNGRVEGDLVASGGTVRVNGPVGGSLRAVAGTVEVQAPVGWDVAALGVGTLTVASTATVAHDVAIVQAGTVTIAGTVRGAVRGSAGTLIVAGRVDGDVDVTARNVEIRDGAAIRGALRYRSPRPAQIAAGASIAGPIEHTPSGGEGGPQTVVERVWSWLRTVLLRLSWALVAGTLLILLLPRPVAGASDALRSAPLASVLWGLGLLVGVPLVSILLAITIVGIPAALLLLGSYLALLYLSQIVVGITLVRLLPLGIVRSERRLPLWLAMMVGTTLVLVFRLLPLPLGWTFWWSFLAGVLALGAVAVALTGIGLPRPAVSTATPGFSRRVETSPTPSEVTEATPSSETVERSTEEGVRNDLEAQEGRGEEGEEGTGKHSQEG